MKRCVRASVDWSGTGFRIAGSSARTAACLWGTLVLFSLLFSGLQAHSANSVLNGDFSANAALFATFPGYLGGANPATIDGWTHNGTGNAGINGAGISNPFGPTDKSAATYYVFLQTTGAAVSQTVNLSSDYTYFIAFLAANRGRAEDASAAGRVVVADNSTTYYDSGVTVFGNASFQLVTATFATPAVMDGPVRITLSNNSVAGDITVCYSDVSIDPVLFEDDFDSAKSTSLTSPKGRSAGSIRSAIAYAWTGTDDVTVNGALDWDSNGDRDGNNQQPAANGTQSVRLGLDLAPYVAGQVWEVEFDQRVAWSHPLTFGLSDTVQNGAWGAWDGPAYDFAVGQYGEVLRYDTDNEGGQSGPSVAGVFPTPVSSGFYHFRIRIDEPASTVTVWVDEVQTVRVNDLDFENGGRYLSWGEPTQYAGALDNLQVSLVIGPNTVPSGLAAGLLLLVR